MISPKYLAIICKKAMEKAGAEVIRETCRNEREKNKVRKSITYFNIDEHAYQNATTKNARVDVEYNWFITTIKKTR
jgi:hypothetical protein